MVVHYRNQKYSQLKRDFQRRGELFTDPQFPPSNESLFLSGKSEQEIVWKRPGEICIDVEKPKLVVEGLSSTDLNQGRLGNCWFVAACSALSLEKKLWEKVVPDWKEQEWNDNHPEKYAGIFHFHFWRLGEWLDVVIDDYLPTINGELVYMKSQSKNEFWSALLEKAYAKIAGCYEALAGGQTGDALVDFTGGVNESVDIREGGYKSDDIKQAELFDKMFHAHKHKALISCSIALSEGDSPEAVLDCGLIKGHAYCVTDVRQLDISHGMMKYFKKEKIYMLRIRNPWGEKEWTGAWSDSSEEWNKVPQKEKDKLGLKVDDDGEFWMDLHDWSQWFTDVSMCRQVNTSLLSLEKTWHEYLFHGEWKGRSSGGCVNNKDTFCHNPQYLFTIGKDETEVMVSLLQKDVRDQKGLSAAKGGEVGAKGTGENFTIGYHIMKVEENRRYRCHAIQEKAHSGVFTNRRSVFDRFTLNTGSYVIIPSTFDPGQEREFLLRLFTEHSSHAEYLKKDAPSRGMLGYLCCCCVRTPRALVTVHLDTAQDLQKQDLVGAGADPYCIVKCGGSKAVVPTKKNTLNPNFNCRVQFFISNPASAEVVVEVWNGNVLIDRFMGQRTAPVPAEGHSERVTGKLMGRRRNRSEETQGTLTFRIECSNDLRAT